MNYNIYYILLGLLSLVIGIFILRKSRENFEDALVTSMINSSKKNAARGYSPKISNPYATYSGE